MGLRDRIAKAIATGSIEKAPNLPAGSTVLSQNDMLAIANQLQQNYGNTNPLPRAPFSATVPFGPGNPIIPGAINPVNPITGRPEPRRYEYQVAQNINIVPTRLVPFSTLRDAADSIDILRRCIEVTKSKMNGLDFDIVLGADASEKIVAEAGGAVWDEDGKQNLFPEKGGVMTATQAAAKPLYEIWMKALKAGR